MKDEAKKGGGINKFEEFYKRDIFIFMLRLLAPEKYTLKEIGEILSISRERVRQIEAKTSRRICYKKDSPLYWVLKRENTKEKIRTIKESVHIIEIAKQYTKLKKHGKRYVGPCPFCNEKGLVFTIDAKRELFHCFSCGAGGDLVSFKDLIKEKKKGGEE
jgi:hypothetical protein